MRENILPVAVAQHFVALRYIPLRYFALVTKINKKSKAQERVIVLTDLHLYSCTRDDGSIKRCLSLEHIVRILTCKNRCEVALIVMEKGEEYDLFFQTHTPSALDELIRHMPKALDVREFTMSLLGRHNGADCVLKLEKPKGYTRDVADAVRWKVSSWTSLGKPSGQSVELQPQRSGEASRATADDLGTPAHHDSRSRNHSDAATEVPVGQQIPVTPRSVALDTSAGDDDEDDDDVISSRNMHDADSDSGRDDVHSPLGRALPVDRTSLLYLQRDGAAPESQGSVDGADEEDVELVSSGGDDDDVFGDMNVDFGAVHSSPTSGAAAASVAAEATTASRHSAGPTASPSNVPRLLREPRVVEDVPFSTHQARQDWAVVQAPDVLPTALHQGVAVSPTTRGGNRLYTPISLPQQQSVHPTSPPSHLASFSQSTERSFALEAPADLKSLIIEERSKYAAQMLAMSELLALERDNSSTLRRIIDDLRSEVERLSIENMLLRRPLSDL